MSGRPVARRSRAPLPARQRRSVKRASAGLSAVRAAAALAMLVSAAAIYGVGASPAFQYARLQLDGVRFTDPTAVEEAVADARGKNLFLVATKPLETSLEGMHTIERAWVDVRLPGTLAVTIEERQPVLIWQVGSHRFLTDAQGMLFAEVADQNVAAAAGLPVIDDRRLASTGTPGSDEPRSAAAGLGIGSQLDPIDLDAATRLASLEPADVGSSAVSLAVVVTDANGFVLDARPNGWTAVFGFYTMSLRSTEIIAGQVRLLRSLVIGREPLVERVILASETDGTYTPRETAPGTKPSKAP
ncbi:MAG: FtsQ-type POTRA domain-containing protein [Chloroflexi bacterium]|nr:FtsQ-type POTRA domain-containing protein [Chloroflexota bacterium]